MMSVTLTLHFSSPSHASFSSDAAKPRSHELVPFVVQVASPPVDVVHVGEVYAMLTAAMELMTSPFSQAKLSVEASAAHGIPVHVPDIRWDERSER